MRAARRRILRREEPNQCWRVIRPDRSPPLPGGGALLSLMGVGTEGQAMLLWLLNRSSLTVRRRINLAMDADWTPAKTECNGSNKESV